MTKLSQLNLTWSSLGDVFFRQFTLWLVMMTLVLTHSAQANDDKVNKQTILVLGDSLSAGYNMRLDQAWPALLQETLQKKYPSRSWQVINTSISGETSEGGLRRWPSLLQEFRPQWLLLELGANDGLRGYPINTISHNLASIIRSAQQEGIKVAILGIQIPPNYGDRYTKPFFAQYATLANHFKIQRVPFILEKVALDPALMMEDGLHPTPEAQPVILDTILQYLDFSQ